MYGHYVGIDLHRKRCYTVVMDSQGQVSSQRRMSNEAMPAYVATLPKDTLAVIEATGTWSWLYEALKEQAIDVVLAHPKKVRALAAARIKTDKIDATILADLARTNMLPTAYAAPTEIRELRELVRHRSKLVRECTRHKNRIHLILATYNLQIPCSDLFGKRGRAFLTQTKAQLSNTHQLMLDDYLAILDVLGQRLKALNCQIEVYAKTHSQAALLMSMPGIGLHSAVLILAEIGDIRRFSSPKQLCSFAGLVPSTRSSDEHTQRGPITKEGSAWLRWIMVNAAQRAPLASPRLAQFFERTKYRHGSKTARVALARKMLSIIYYLLSRNIPYQEDQQG
jgi:transposase